MNKKPKTNLRVAINTCIFILISLCFGLLTCRGVQHLQLSSKHYLSIIDSPNLCFEKSKTDDGGNRSVQGAYLCSSKTTNADHKNEHLTNSEDQTLFLYNKLAFSSLMRSNDLMILLVTIGSMFTIASLAGGVIYWIHNKIQ